MTLRELYEKADRASYYSRQDADMFDALNHAGLKVYLRVVKEMKGFFLKWDETSLQLVPGTDSYQLPSDLEQIVSLGERLQGSSDRYYKLAPAEVNTVAYLWPDVDFGWAPGWAPMQSRFIYSGPYLPGVPTPATPPDATQPGQQKAQEIFWIRISPVPTDTRQTRICYTARYVEIVNERSPVMLPSESHEAMLAYAVAELVRRNSDNLSAEYEGRGEQDMTDFLAGYVRPRQIDDGPFVTPYLFDMD
jgi:hypothetical protein